jgi:hypothetical protein
MEGWLTGVGQHNDVHICLLMRCWTSFSIQNSCNPSWNGLVQSWTVSGGMPYHSSGRTTSSWFRVWRWEFVPHSSLQNWRERFSVVQMWLPLWPEKLLESPPCSSNHDWTVQLFLVRKHWSWDAPNYQNRLFTYFLGVILPWTSPLWSSGQSSWLHNGDVLCFLWGTNWICICYVKKVDRLCVV